MKLRYFAPLMMALIGTKTVLFGVEVYASTMEDQSMVEEIPHDEIRLAPPSIQEYIQRQAANVKSAFAHALHRSMKSREMQCLVDNIVHEAAYEPEEGKIAVALVTLNRTHTKGYPGTVCGVVYEKHDLGFSGQHKWICQFSWACEGNPHQFARVAIEEAKRIAQDVLVNHVTLNGFDESITQYHAVYMKKFPKWATDECFVTQIGLHMFYTNQCGGYASGGRPTSDAVMAGI